MRPTGVRHLPVLAAAGLVILVAGCGQATSRGRPAAGDPAGATYAGPLVIPRDQAEHPEAGAAGDVVACRTWGRGGVQDAEVYAEGATARTPEKALEVARSERIVDGVFDWLRVAGRTDDRLLYVLEVGGEPKQAVVLRDGPATEGAGGPGWYVESWARCDAAEMPRSYTDGIGLLVWEDAATGVRVPTTEVEAWRGPEHCDWQSMTFLHLEGEIYVRNPHPDLVADFFAEDWRPHTRLPEDAVDTGYQREGEHLWLSADRRRAFVGSEDDVELWPRTTESLGCE